MPHQCIHCGKNYSDGAEQILKGCGCGGRFFFYLTEEKLEKLQEKKQSNEPGIEIDLSPSEKEQIEKDVRDIAQIKDDDTPIVLDFESINVLKPGKYLIDLQKLFKGEKPVIYRLEDGKYIIDLTSLKRN